jgi:hypothetical protein
VASKNAGIAMIVGGALLAVGSFLAWVTVGSASQSGIDGGDGWFTLVAGAAFALLGYLTFAGRSYPMWLGWVALAVGAAVAIIDYLDITSSIDDFGEGSVGIGMWVMLAGVVIGIVGLVMGRKSSNA